jgi:hypothetical protein
LFSKAVASVDAPALSIVGTFLDLKNRVLYEVITPMKKGVSDIDVKINNKLCQARSNQNGFRGGKQEKLFLKNGAGIWDFKGEENSSADMGI